MTFNKFTEDFNFAVNLNNLDHLEKSELANIDGEWNLWESYIELSFGLRGVIYREKSI